MQSILIFGAGKSATSLIEYLGNCCDQNQWQLIVCDADISLAQSKIKCYQSARAVSIDVSDGVARGKMISEADIVISMLPAALHFLVAKDCVRFFKNLLTASYIDANIESLQKSVEENGLLFLGEMGLDPGIDHMSAMQMIDAIKNKGGNIHSFKSHCGGLVSPESDDNPWHYKITWNPRNVITAGSAGAVFLRNGEVEEISYKDIFKDEDNAVEIPGLFTLAWYANRDSMPYIDIYHLHGIKTFIRTTLRYPAFCRGWNKIVNMNLAETHDTDLIGNCKTYADWFQLKKDIFLSSGISPKLGDSFFDHEFLEQLNFLEIRNSHSLPEKAVSSADILQYQLEKKLVMKPHDKDMIVMLHEIEYAHEEKNKLTRSCLIVKGDDPLHTSMAKTVGLPLGIAAKLILQKKIQLKGIYIPVVPEIYVPVLNELAQNGIKFAEETQEL